MSSLELPLHEVVMADDETVSRQPSFTRALVVCSDLAGFEDKQAADAAGVDPGTWSKIKSGQANFPHVRLRNFQQRCGYWLPLQWLARDSGFRIERLESELERKLRETETALAEEKRLRAYAESLLIGRTPR